MFRATLFVQAETEMQKIIPLVLLVLTGCGAPTTPAIPPTADDFVKNNDGIGTARVFGIDFSVSLASSGASTNDSINAKLNAPESSIARKRFTIGDDVTIQLDSVDESKVRFMFNDEDLGTLSVGDNVVIDERRNVEVNGISRSSASTK